MQTEKYEAVIGLEVHVQLATDSKLFSGDATIFGALPNTQVDLITLAHPGTLPKLNKKAIEYAIKMGLVCRCEIEHYNIFARKHYFYPDSPKGFQTTQYTHPICKGGFITISASQGIKNIRLHHIHLEEDAGKSIHDIDHEYSMVDLNRAGTPLIEIVTEPEIYSSEEAFQFLTEIRKLVRWIDISDGNMEEGSLRCDANISIRLRGEKQLGTKVEVKNLNSIRNVRRAIDYEIERLVNLTEQNQPIIQQTRSYDADKNITFSIREKENANDYRYFPDPDLPPFIITEEYIEAIRETIPILPEALKNKLKNEYGLNEYDVEQLTADKETAEYFILLTKSTNNYKAAANWILGPVKQYLNEYNLSFKKFLPPDKIAAVIKLIDNGKINFSIASSKLLPALFSMPDYSAEQLAIDMNLVQTSSQQEIIQWVEIVISKMPDKVQAYKKGKKGLMGLFVGEVKKLSKGTADPITVTNILEEKLKTQ